MRIFIEKEKSTLYILLFSVRLGVGSEENRTK